MVRPQWAARLALLSIFAVSGVGLLAAPATADPDGGLPSASASEPAPDPAGEGDEHHLVLTAHGTTVTADGGKTGLLTINNQGPSNVVDAGIDFDLAALGTDKVGFELLPADGCQATGKTGIACTSIGERTTIDVLFRLTPVKGVVPGPAGTITAVLTDSLHEGNEAHVLTFPVAIASSGPDLLVWAPDQPFKTDGTTGKIKRGEDGTLAILIANQGDQVVSGVRVTTKLVKGATFTALDGCQVAVDQVTLTCEFADLTLIPAAADTDPADDRWSAVEFNPGVHIAADAKSPQGWPDLPGNTVTVEPLGVASSKLAAAVTALPEGIKGISLQQLDVDATDNTDDFTIMVAAADEGTGDEGAGGGQGGGGGLPITGAPAAIVAGLGLAILIAGGLILTFTRRKAS